MEVTGWDAAAALLKAISYAATLGAAGSVFFLIYSGSLLRAMQRTRIARSVAVLVIVAAAASAAKVLLLAGSMSGNFAGMLDISYSAMIMHAGEGRAIGIRVVGLILCGTVLKTGRTMNLVAAAGALLAAASFAALGHVHALKPSAAATLLLTLHLCGGSFWLGALWPLLQIARGGDGAQTAAIAARFSRIAMTVVTTLIAAGALLLYRLLGSVTDLWVSAYGRMLCLKLLLVSALLCAAAYNKLRLTPRLAAGDARAGIQLQRSILTEMLLGGMILLTTAALTSFAGPGD